MSDLKEFIGTKIIYAKPMNRLDYNIFRGWELPANENGSDEGYLVEYKDGGEPNTKEYQGYVSWSPKEQFENAYKQSGNLSFGDAITYLKLGYKVARTGWNGNKTPPIIQDYPKYIPTQRIEYVEELDLVYILLSNNDVAVCSGCDLDRLKTQEKWSISDNGYPYFTDYSDDKRTVKLQNFIYDNIPNGYIVDHINGNKLDNRRENLRLATYSENNANRKSRNGSSIYKGVSFDKSRNKWISSIQVNGKTQHIGRFDDEIECAKAYDKKCYEIYGEYAKLNFPNEPLPPRMFIYYVAEGVYPARMPAIQGCFENDQVPCGAYIAMKTAQGNVVPWLASQADMLSTDWCLVN